MAGLTILVFAGLFGCALAAPAPAPEPCLHPGGYTPNSIQGFFYSMEMYQSYKWSFYEVEMCMEFDIDVPPYTPSLYYDEFERMILKAKCNYINYYNSLYPQNYTPQIRGMTRQQLTFDYIIMGGSPSTFTLLTYLLEMGYSVALIESGMLAPPQIYSPYYSPSVLGSPFMNRVPAYIPGLKQPKNFYTANMLGGIHMIESNQWLHGSKNYYQLMAQYSDYFEYSKVMSRFSSFEYTQTTTTETSTSYSSNGFGMSYYTYSKETTTTSFVQSWYSDLGYSNFSPFDDCYQPGLYSMPTIGSSGMYSLYTDEIFSRISSFEKLYMFLGVQINRLIYEMGIITGIEIITEFGLQIIYCRFDVFFGTSTIDMFKILTKSGIGNSQYMNRFGIQPLVNLPALGTGFRCTPSYVNPFLLFPKFSLVSSEISDYSSMSFMFGSSQNYMTSFDSLYNSRAFTNVGGSSYSNAMYQFYAFNSLMMNRLEYILSYQFQLTYEQIEYIRTCLVEYDVLFISTTLMETESVGYLEFGETIEDVIIRSELYSSQTDISYMTEAIMYLQQIFQTSSFMSSGAQVRYLSSMGSTTSMSNFFNANSIQATLSMYSYFNFQSSGGSIMGNSMSTSVVNNNFNFYNVGNLFALNSGISPYSMPHNNLAINTLFGNFAYDIVQNRINSGFYEKMRSAEFYENMINSNMGGMTTRGLNTNTMGIDTMGGMNTVGMNTMGLSNMGGLNSMQESMYESESMLEMESMNSGGYLNTGGINSIGGAGSGIKSIGGGIGGINSLGGNSMSSSSFSETEMESSNLSMGGSSLGGFGSMQQESSYMSTETEASTTMINGGGLYGGGSSMVSEYEMEMEAESSSMMQSSGFGGGSTYYSEQEMEMEASTSSSNVMVC